MQQGILSGVQVSFGEGEPVETGMAKVERLDIDPSGGTETNQRQCAHRKRY